MAPNFPLRKFAGLAGVTVLALAALVATPAGARAQTPAPTIQTAPTVTDGGVVDNFPDGMTFSVHAESISAINDIRLHYKILPDGTAANAVPDFTPGKSVDATVSLGGASLYLPPGTIIQYNWQVADARGSGNATPEQSFFYDDVRFHWQKLSADNLTIYHYTGSDSDAQKLHDVGVQAIADAEALLGVQVPFNVNVWIYDSSDDMNPALPRTSPAFESKIITEGIKIASDTVLVLGGVSYDTLRHELTHIVTAIAGDSALGSLPPWLDEGTAVHAQQDQGGFKVAIVQAIGLGQVLSIHEISSYPGDPTKVELFYGESWSIVSFLVDTYGQPKFAQLFSAIKSGKTLDDAFQTVYGFDQDGLENAWRAAHNLPARLTDSPMPSGQTTTPAATLEPAADAGRGMSTGELIAIGVAVVALAAIVGFAGITLARKV